MDENPQKELVTQIALDDQRRRTQAEALHWDAEFNFWHKLISEEVERFRFNEGYEPIEVDLYPAVRKFGPAFLGKTQIGHLHFRVEGKWRYDSGGNKVLHLTILKEPK